MPVGPVNGGGSRQWQAFDFGGRRHWKRKTKCRDSRLDMGSAGLNRRGGSRVGCGCTEKAVPMQEPWTSHYSHQPVLVCLEEPRNHGRVRLCRRHDNWCSCWPGWKNDTTSFLAREDQLANQRTGTLILLLAGLLPCSFGNSQDQVRGWALSCGPHLVLLHTFLLF